MVHRYRARVLKLVLNIDKEKKLWVFSGETEYQKAQTSGLPCSPVYVL